MLTDKKILQKARELVNKQVEDEGLWFITEHASEAYLQQALRELHAIIENIDVPKTFKDFLNYIKKRKCD